MKLVVKFLLMMPVVFFCFSASAQKGNDSLSFVEKHGQLKVVGTQLTDVYNQPIVLHGMSFGWSNFHPRFYNPGAVRELVKNWHVKVLRLAMGVEPDGAYLSNPKESEKLIRKTLEACIDEGVYVIIDWHAHHIHTKEAVAFFTRIAKDYAQFPNVIYEVYNEPIDDTWAEVKTYAQTVIAAIRKYDKNNVILVGSPHWDQDIHLVAENPLLDVENVMYTVHFYAATHKQWLRDRANAALKKGVPIFISECAAMEATGDGPIDLEEWNAWVQWMKSKHISWAAWSVSDKNETCSVLNPTASSTGSWSEKDIKKWGQVVRENLQENSN